MTGIYRSISMSLKFLLQQSLSGADTIGEESSNLSDLKTDYGGPEYSLEERGQRIAAMVSDIHS